MEWIWLHDRSVVTYTKENNSYTDGIFSDITGRKEEEELRKAKALAESNSRAKNEFLANISHEFRSPLNAVIGFSQVLLEQPFGPLTEKQKEYVGYVLESGNHLLLLIDAILNLTQIDTGEVNLEFSEFFLKDVVNNVIESVKEETVGNSVEIQIDIPEEIKRIKADEAKLKIILYHLLMNAVKFSPAGKKAGIKVKKAVAGIEFTVWDNGIGIAKENMEQIFKPLTQIDGTRSKAYQGIGLGLTLSRKLVELHGGKLWVESEGKDKGSVFKFTLPI